METDKPVFILIMFFLAGGCVSPMTAENPGLEPLTRSLATAAITPSTELALFEPIPVVLRSSDSGHDH